MAKTNRPDDDSRHHNPTSEERDERFSLYGLDPEKVIEAILQTSPQEHQPEASSKPKRQRRKHTD